MSTVPPQVSSKLFGLFCLASYLLSLSYGATFLLSLLIGSQGGNEHDAGSVISAAMLSTFAAVIVSGHLSDRLGAARSIALFGLLLVVASLGFALTPGFGNLLLFFGLLLGLGWGVFYALGPIIVASLVTPSQRAKYFALLSGSMMTGIGSGPLLGRAASALGYPVTAAFYLAALASLVGVVLFWRLDSHLKKPTPTRQRCHEFPGAPHSKYCPPKRCFLSSWSASAAASLAGCRVSRPAMRRRAHWITRCSFSGLWALPSAAAC